MKPPLKKLLTNISLTGFALTLIGATTAGTVAPTDNLPQAQPQKVTSTSAQSQSIVQTIMEQNVSRKQQNSSWNMPTTSSLATFTDRTSRVSEKARTYTYFGKKDFWSLKGAIPTHISLKFSIMNIYKSPNRNFWVQQYDSKKKKWVNSTGARKSDKGGYWSSVNLSLPRVTTQGTTSYRVYSPDTATMKAYTSHTFKVKRIDPRKYTGEFKKMYKYMKAYCPNTYFIKSKPNRYYAGRAEYGLYQIEFATPPYYTNEQKRALALHECAHLVQGKTFPNYNEMVRKSNALMGLSQKKGSLGLEKLADCMTFVKGVNPKHGGYIRGGCSTKQNNAARKVWAGKKF